MDEKPAKNEIEIERLLDEFFQQQIAILEELSLQDLLTQADILEVMLEPLVLRDTSAAEVVRYLMAKQFSAKAFCEQLANKLPFNRQDREALEKNIQFIRKKYQTHQFAINSDLAAKHNLLAQQFRLAYLDARYHIDWTKVLLDCPDAKPALESV